jgi:integrase
VRRAKREKRNRQFRCTGGKWVFRAPFEQDGTWRYRKRHTGDGRIVCEVLKAKNGGDAELEVRALAKKADEEPELAPEADRATVRGALEEWRKSLDVGAKTMDGYKRELAVFRKVLGEDKAVSSLKLEDIERLFNEGGPWRTLSGRTKRLRLGLLKRWGLWLLAHKLVREDPAAAYPNKQPAWRKDVKARKRRKFAPNLEEVRKLLGAAESLGGAIIPMRQDGKPEPRRPKQAAWWEVFIMARTGLRVSNVLGSEFKVGLTWGDLDLEGGRFTLPVDKVRQVPMKGPGLHIPAERMKNGEDFTVPIGDELAEKLRELRASLGRVPADEERVVPGPCRELKRSFAKAVKRAKLPAMLSPHSLRRHFATVLDSHATAKVVKYLMAHMDQNQTEEYIYPPEAELRGALNRLPRLLSESAALDGQEATA